MSRHHSGIDDPVVRRQMLWDLKEAYNREQQKPGMAGWKIVDCEGDQMNCMICGRPTFGRKCAVCKGEIPPTKEDRLPSTDKRSTYERFITHNLKVDIPPKMVNVLQVLLGWSDRKFGIHQGLWPTLVDDDPVAGLGHYILSFNVVECALTSDDLQNIQRMAGARRFTINNGIMDSFSLGLEL